MSDRILKTISTRTVDSIRLFLVVVSVFLLNACVVMGQHKGTDEEIARANVDLAIEYYRLGNTEIALTSLKKALNADPRNVEANSFIALIYTRLNKNDKAEEHYEIAIEHVAPDTVLYGQVHNNYGTFLCANNRFIDGEEQIQLAIEDELYKSPAAAYENAGFCALGREDAEMARLYFDKALKLNANTPRALLEIAMLDVAEKKHVQALKTILRFHKSNKASPQSLWIALQAEVALGNRIKAQKLLAQIKQEFPDADERAKGDSLLMNK